MQKRTSLKKLSRSKNRNSIRQLKNKPIFEISYGISMIMILLLFCQTRLYSKESQKLYFQNEITKINTRLNELKEAYFTKMRILKKGGALSQDADEHVCQPVTSTPTQAFERIQAELRTSTATDKLGFESVREIFKRYTLDQEKILEELQLRKSTTLITQRYVPEK